MFRPMQRSITEWMRSTDDLNIRFIKNDEGKREAQPLDEIQLEESKKEIGVIVIGHIWHIQTQIIEILNRHSENIHADIVTIHQQTELPWKFMWSWSLEQCAQKITEEMVISLRKVEEDISCLFFRENKPQYNKHSYHTPKTQKSKVSPRRYIPRKK